MTHLVSDTKLMGKAYGEEGEGSILGTTGLLRRVGTIPIPAQRTAVIRQIQKRLEELEPKSIQRAKQKAPDNSDIDGLDYLSPKQRENIKRVRELQRQDEEERLQEQK